MRNNTITIDTRCLPNYASYYILGLRESFPKARIKWNAKAFDYTILDHEEYRKGVGIIIPFELINEIYASELNRDLRIYIDFNDSDTINKKILAWCDVYAKINLRSEDRHIDKIIPIGPSFGIIWQNKLSAVISGVANYLNQKNISGYKISPKELLHGYFYPFARRLKYPEYLKPSKSKKDYCFAMSTLWYDNLTDTTTNKWRSVFMRNVKNIIPDFEGGFFFIDLPEVEQEFPKYKEYKVDFADIITTNRVPMVDYLEKTRNSEFVFNTPSVLGCHGWKLAEYLAMGKAIISTPITHEMPGDFCSGKQLFQLR